jgi:RNA polymerase sigma-70 factor (ECF subfamily)
MAWLYRIATNVVNDYFRSRKSRPEEPMNERIAEGAQARAADPSTAVGRRLDLEQAMGCLTGEQRELITLKFIQGLSNAEIGEATGRSPEAVRALQFRALSALRENLKGR